MESSNRRPAQAYSFLIRSPRFPITNIIFSNPPFANQRISYRNEFFKRGATEFLRISGITAARSN
jgi:hypothetical protein